MMPGTSNLRGPGPKNVLGCAKQMRRWKTHETGTHYKTKQKTSIQYTLYLWPENGLLEAREVGVRGSLNGIFHPWARWAGARRPGPGTKCSRHIAAQKASFCFCVWNLSQNCSKMFRIDPKMLQKHINVVYYETMRIAGDGFK